MLDCFLDLLHNFIWVIAGINLHQMDTGYALVSLDDAEIKTALMRRAL